MTTLNDTEIEKKTLKLLIYGPTRDDEHPRPWALTLLINGN